jgi:small subunit ribosomal protein S6
MEKVKHGNSPQRNLQFTAFFYTLDTYKPLDMNQYEITYISNPNLDESERAQLDSTIDAKITELSGNTIHTTSSLRRRLAYQIEKNTSGFLRYLHLELAPEHIATIQDWLRKENNVLRFSILATIKRPEVSAEITAKYVQKKGDAKKKPVKAATRAKTKAAAPVTMEDVEKGIEEALTEEVK